MSSSQTHHDNSQQQLACKWNHNILTTTDYCSSRIHKISRIAHDYWWLLILRNWCCSLISGTKNRTQKWYKPKRRNNWGWVGLDWAVSALSGWIGGFVFLFSGITLRCSAVCGCASGAANVFVFCPKLRVAEFWLLWCATMLQSWGKSIEKWWCEFVVLGNEKEREKRRQKH